MTMRGAQSGQFVIPANGRVPVQGQGQFIRCLEANGVFTVSVNNGSELYFASGISFTAPDFEDYTEFALINRTGAPVTVIMAWGFGAVSDNRLTATGNLFVINAPATTLKVDDDETQTAIAAAASNIASMMQNDQDQRMPLTTLTGAAYASGTGTTTIVSAGTNVNGVIIRLARFTTSGTGAVCSMLAGGNLLLQTMNTNKSDFPLQNIFVPAGVAITTSVAGSGEWYIWYEVL